MTEGKKMGIAERVLGPHVPPEEMREHWTRYQAPRAFFAAAAVLLVISIFFPYWSLKLVAPQYPKGLYMHAYVNRLEGVTEKGLNALDELEELNHYVGMPSFSTGAVLERSISIIAIVAIAGILLAALVFRSRWVVLFTIPALLFPLLFLADLQFWLWKYGHSLDRSAPLADAVGDFTPPVLGAAKIANFETLALPGLGLILAFVASILIVVGLVLHRRAYKPLVDEAEAEEKVGADKGAAAAAAAGTAADDEAPSASAAGAEGTGSVDSESEVDADEPNPAPTAGQADAE